MCGRLGFCFNTVVVVLSPNRWLPEVAVVARVGAVESRTSGGPLLDSQYLLAHAVMG